MYVLTLDDSNAFELTRWEFYTRGVAQKEMLKQYERSLASAIRRASNNNVDGVLTIGCSARIKARYPDGRTSRMMWSIRDTLKKI